MKGKEKSKGEAGKVGMGNGEDWEGESNIGKNGREVEGED